MDVTRIVMCRSGQVANNVRSALAALYATMSCSAVYPESFEEAHRMLLQEKSTTAVLLYGRETMRTEWVREAAALCGLQVIDVRNIGCVRDQNRQLFASDGVPIA